MNEYGEKINMENELKYDKVLAQCLQESKGFEGYFDVVFGYLGRSTDFFMQEDTARNNVEVLLEKHIEKFRRNTKLQEAIAKK